MMIALTEGSNDDDMGAELERYDLDLGIKAWRDG